MCCRVIFLQHVLLRLEDKIKLWHACLLLSTLKAGIDWLQEVLDWFQAKGLTAYSISFGAALLYNNIFPKHNDRLGKKLSALIKTVAKVDLPDWRRHFDVVVACEDDDGEDVDVPLVSIRYK
jgi:hypothetical protein